jgi:PKD repeat protein
MSFRKGGIAMNLRYLACTACVLVTVSFTAAGQDLVVSGESVTIEGNREIDGSIFVENGGVLTIRNAHVTLILDYDEEHHIDVADSSKLIIENSVIDSVGGQFWFELYGDGQGANPTLQVSGADTWLTNHSGIRPFDATNIIINGGDVEELQLRDQVTVTMNDGAAYMVFFFDGDTAVISNLDTGTGLNNTISVPGKWSFSMTNSWVEGYQIDLMNGADVTINSGDGIVLSIHTPGNLGPDLQIVEGITSDGRISGSSTNLGSRFTFNDCNLPLFNVYLFGDDRVLLRNLHVNEVNAEERSELTIGQEGYETLLNCNLCQVYDDATFIVEHATIDNRENTPSATSSYHDLADIGRGVMTFREMALEDLFLTVLESGTMNLHNCSHDAGKLTILDDGIFNDYHLSVDFEGSPLSGPAPLAVTFNDRSVGEAIAWSWDLGDGTSSIEHQPGHTYTSEGVYTVSLTVTGPAGSNSVTKTDYITTGGGVPGSSSQILLPGQAWAEGAAQTSWLSEVWIFNPGSAKAVDFSFWPSGTDNTGATPLRTVNLGAGSYLSQDDFLEFLGVPFPSVGSVVLDFELEGEQDLPLVAGARTYNDVEDGTFGQYIWAASEGHDMVLPGALRSDAFRSNVGLVNGGASPRQFSVTLLGATRVFTVPAQSSRQLNDVFAALGLSGDGIGTVVITADGEAGSTYLSIIDNTTGDPTYLAPLSAMSEGFLPGCARAPGALGTQWYTDAVFANLGTAPVEISLEFLSNGRDNTSGGPTTTFTLGADSTTLLADLVGESLASAGVGTVHFTATAPIHAWARTYNLETLDNHEATFGQTILPTSAEGMIAAEEEIVYLFARGDEFFRSNVACFNPNTGAAALSLTAFDDLGQPLGQRSFTVPARSGLQVNDVFGALDLRFDTEVTIIATMDQPSTGYLSMVDNATGDGITVFPVVMAR